jgi:hypothetical protein
MAQTNRKQRSDTPTRAKNLKSMILKCANKSKGVKGIWRNTGISSFAKAMEDRLE